MKDYATEYAEILEKKMRDYEQNIASHESMGNKLNGLECCLSWVRQYHYWQGTARYASAIAWDMKQRKNVLEHRLKKTSRLRPFKRARLGQEIKCTMQAMMRVEDICEEANSHLRKYSR